MTTIDPNNIPSHILHRYILSAVAPRPIAFASTLDAKGNPNLSPFSCFNAFGVNPSTLIFSPSRTGRSNALKDTYLNVKEVPEVVINVVTYSMVEQMNLASAEFEHGVDEFLKAGFTAIPSERVRPFRVKESPIQIECRVRDVIETGSGPGAANLVICEVVLIHASDECFDENGNIDSAKLDLVGRLGGDLYVRAAGDALFSLPKPEGRAVVGVDALPFKVRLSRVLTGNDLGRLGSVKAMPDMKEIEDFLKSNELKKLLDGHLCYYDDEVDEIHSLARDLIAEGRDREALLLLMATEHAG